MENLNNKYNILDKEIQQIKSNISDIKNLLLSVLNKEERSNGNR
jgi:prefoldin subunit 5